LKRVVGQDALEDRSRKKILPIEKAMEIWKQAEGDKNLAREMALKGGWTIPNVDGEPVWCRIEDKTYVRIKGRWHET
jgi:hypothetical protein